MRRPPEGAPARGGGRIPGRRPRRGKGKGKGGLPGLPPPPPYTVNTNSPTSELDQLKELIDSIYGPQRDYLNSLLTKSRDDAAARQRSAQKWYEDVAKYIGGTYPAQIQGIYGAASANQANFAKGFSDGMQASLGQTAGADNAELTRMGAPQGQQIGPGQAEAAGNVVYGLGGAIPANTLNQQGAAFGSLAALQPGFTLQQGAAYIKELAKKQSEDEAGINESLAKLASDQAGTLAEQTLSLRDKQQQRRDAAKANASKQATDLYNAGLITQREFARRMGIKDWRRYPNVAKPGDSAGVDASASKLIGWLIDDDGNFIRDRKGNRIPVAQDTNRRTQVVGSDATGRKLIDMDTGEVIATITKKVPRTKKDKAAGAVTCYNTSQGIICLDAQGKVVPGAGSLSPGTGSNFDENAMAKANVAAQSARYGIPSSNPGLTGGKYKQAPIKTWDAAVDYVMSKDQDITRPMAEWALWKYRRHLKGAPKKRPPNPKASAPPSGGGNGRNASFSTGSAPTQGGNLIGTPYSGTHTLGNWESDNAIDVAVPYGSPIYAVDDGVIGPQFGSLGSGGRFAGLRLHLVTGNNEFYYAHLSRFAPGIRPNMRVRKGQLIGFSGAANGVNHLHFGMRNGDPRSFYGRGGSV